MLHTMPMKIWPLGTLTGRLPSDSVGKQRLEVVSDFPSRAGWIDDLSSKSHIHFMFFHAGSNELIKESQSSWNWGVKGLLTLWFISYSDFPPPIFSFLQLKSEKWTQIPPNVNQKDPTFNINSNEKDPLSFVCQFCWSTRLCCCYIFKSMVNTSGNTSWVGEQKERLGFFAKKWQYYQSGRKSFLRLPAALMTALFLFLSWSWLNSLQQNFAQTILGKGHWHTEQSWSH